MLRILVVEDDPVQRKVEEIILKRNHYEVFTAFDAEEALRLLDRSSREGATFRTSRSVFCRARTTTW